ncbi:ABC transporter permease [Streptobacillus canis]|uniref:ABC transporter permease n=1 Tax=Streptobacillus canis TaxID=2678686 RepID=UPI0018CC01E9|nr:ABC-2 family transporter protein [Streptobacillus canis]
MKYLRLYLLRMKYSFKILLNSMSNFIIGFLGFLFIQLSAIIFINITFSKIPTIEGYSFYQIMTLYGFSQISKGLDHFYSDYLWMLSVSSIARGEYDKFMIRPVNTFFQVIIERVQFDAMGEIFVGILIYIYGIKGLGIPLSFRLIFLSIFFIVIGTIIYTALKTIAASYAFKVKDSYFLLKAIYSFSEFTKYPIAVYPIFLQIALTYILAFAITANYPIDILLFGDNLSIYFKIITVTLVIVIIAIICWKKGEKAYESAGA